MNRKLIVLAALAVLAVPALASSSASAATASFRNSTDITIPSQGSATPYPSTVLVRNLEGPVVDVEVALNNVSHTRPRDLDVLLVAPDGVAVRLMSDVCGTTDVVNHSWVFRSNTFLVPQMGQTSCPSLYYQATDVASGSPDAWPNASVTAFRTLSDFYRKTMTGQWKLYVVDDEAGDAGTIGGWSLTLTTGPTTARIPGVGSSGPANTYPLTRTEGTTGTVITDMSVAVPILAHDRPDDVDLLLVGPRGQKAMLMSDACGTAPYENRLQFYDGAPSTLSDDGSLACGNYVKPADYEPGDALPAPAPAGPYAASLSTFDFTDPEGEWRLFAFDDSEGGDGYIRNGTFELFLTTRPKATVELADSGAEVPEGNTRTVTLRRSATGGLGEASVRVTTVSGSAASGDDFTPVSRTVRFAPDEREQAILLDARADGASEPGETYALAVSAPTGDAALATRTRLDVTIPASAGPLLTPAALRSCAGKRATLVGTARRDVLRGTKRADVIVALGGNDRIEGARGNDVICGGTGSDRLIGGRGRDTCLGGKGRDRASCERKKSA